MSEKSFGVAVVAEDGIIKGVISDGDMRRNVSRLWHSTASDIATPLPVLIRKDWLAADAVGLMTSEGITAALVEDDEGRLIGLLHIHDRSEEHTSELQSLMRISYAVFCLKKTRILSGDCSLSNILSYNSYV